MAILVIAEHDNARVQASTLNTVTAATELSGHGAGDVVLLVAGSGCASAADAAAKIAGVSNVLLADDPAQEHALAENLASLVVGLAGEYSHILAPASTYGKNFLPTRRRSAGRPANIGDLGGGRWRNLRSSNLCR